MTNQEIFDRVARHLLTQGKKSERHGDGSGCLYRGPGGTKCAVGCLITDEAYDLRMENCSVSSIWNKGYEDVEAEFLSKALTKSGVTIEALRLLDSLQGVHDNSGVGLWPSRLRMVAENFDLSWDVLDQF